jgi:guanylate kinase
LTAAGLVDGTVRLAVGHALELADRFVRVLLRLSCVSWPVSVLVHRMLGLNAMAATLHGFVLILSAPSGTGKTTLARYLTTQPVGVRFSISTTTRDCRPREREGIDYFFVSQETFAQRYAANEFLESAEVFGHRYGTSRTFVTAALERGEVVLLDIDWQGARQVRSSLTAAEVVSVMILPPSREVLGSRLQQRGRDTADVIAQRMARAEAEASHWDEYDYVVINDRLEQAQADLLAIVRAEKLRRVRMAGRVGMILQEQVV